MTVAPQGIVKTVTAGTRVQFPAVASPLVTGVGLCRITITQPLGNTGAVSVGGSGVVHSTKVGVIRQFGIPGTATFLDDFELAYDDNGNTIDPTQFYVDSAVNAEGILVTYYQR